MKLDLRESLYLISMGYLKKERYTGSSDGIRFMLEKFSSADEEDKLYIRTCIWPEPYCFEKTAEEDKHYRDFPFSKEGLEQAIDYLMGVV